jgi:hypothetical protein
MTRSGAPVGGGYEAASIWFPFHAVRAPAVGKVLYGAEFGSNMHDWDNTGINMHRQVYSCDKGQNEAGN